jgi:hypothetical protein
LLQQAHQNRGTDLTNCGWNNTSKYLPDTSQESLLFVEETFLFDAATTEFSDPQNRQRQVMQKLRQEHTHVEWNFLTYELLQRLSAYQQWCKVNNATF